MKKREAGAVKCEGIDPCRFCSYREVCLFDERLDAQRVRRLPALSSESALLQMKLEKDNMILMSKRGMNGQ